MNDAPLPEAGDKDSGVGEAINSSETESQVSEREARVEEAPDTSFSGEEQPIVRRVFKKLCNLSDTLEEIEGWIDARSESELRLLLPSSVKESQIVLTPENLDVFVAAERQAIVEIRDACGGMATWTI